MNRGRDGKNGLLKILKQMMMNHECDDRFERVFLSPAVSDISQNLFMHRTHFRHFGCGFGLELLIENKISFTVERFHSES